MLHHAIDQHRMPNSLTRLQKSINLHADNCSGQNKNHFMLWYLLWRVCMDFETRIVLRFLVAGHTKNRCDAAFGLVKRRLKQFDVFCPRDMMKVISESSKSNEVVCSRDVLWFNWKLLLSRFFTIPPRFKLSMYHVFEFSSTYKEGVSTKKLSSDQGTEQFTLLRTGVTREQVRDESVSLLQNPSLVLNVTPLQLVPSAQEKNREAYLVKNVLDRYYEHDAQRREE